ncbi:hypothetical protein GCM10014719_59990 [Planomonospora parontospora subsp. antibiotica]|nr:hypothetical protein GCM10014719_59990 [Planomonospora parontospora subsp. antibiotica]GII19065.1 hypothetical protein Ppa05_57910 [Planomonospora parontospora subsp. antibiotica]
MGSAHPERWPAGGIPPGAVDPRADTSPEDARAAGPVPVHAGNGPVTGRRGAPERSDGRPVDAAVQG